MWDEITYSFPNFKGATGQVWEWIGNFIQPITRRLITDPCFYQNQSLLEKGSIEVEEKVIWFILPQSNQIGHTGYICCWSELILILAAFNRFSERVWQRGISKLFRNGVLNTVYIVNFNGFFWGYYVTLNLTGIKLIPKSHMSCA